MKLKLLKKEVKEVANKAKEANVLGGRFPYSLTLTNCWVSTKGKDFPGISPVVTSVIYLLRPPRVMSLPLIFQGLTLPPYIIGGNFTLNYFKTIT